MVIFFMILALIGFIIGLVCFIIRRAVKKGLKAAVNAGDIASAKAKLPRIAQKHIHRATSAGAGEIKLALKPFMTKVLVVELIAWAISGICLTLGLYFLIMELTMMGVIGMDYSHEDSEGDCYCIAECVYGAKTVDYSKTSYDERALWANGFYLTHDPYNAAAFMNYALYVQSEGAFKSPATDTAKKLVLNEIKWSEGTEYECTFSEYMGSENYPLIGIHYSFGDFRAVDCYLVTDGAGVQHTAYINTAFYRFKHEAYLKEKFPDQSFMLTEDAEHTYIQGLLDNSPITNYDSCQVTADDWKEYPEVSAVVGNFFCTVYEYARAHKATDGTQTDYKAMVGELAAYAKWFYNNEATEGILSELTEADYYAYGGQTADATDSGGYKFVPAYGNDAVYMTYYENWIGRYGTSDESLADMLYYIMEDNKRCGANSSCYLCGGVMAECEGAPWWMDYSGLFHYVENNRIGWEYSSRRGGGGRSYLGDIRPQAMAIAQEMMSPVAYHVRSGCTCVIKDTNIPHKWYCVKGGYDSQLIPAHFYACCGGGSTATAVLAGLTEPGSVNSGGTVACPEDYTIAFGGANADLTLTYADIPVGSIICGGDNAPPETVLNLKPGQGLGSDHCTILVYKDETKAYIAGFGGDAPIEDIAAKGWRSSYDINALAKSEVSGRAYIYIYTPNRQLAGGSGDMPDVEGYANPTDIESGRFDMSLLEGAGVDVGNRRFDGSWYTQLNGWTQASSASKTVSSGSDTYALYDSPPYVFSDFSKVYFYDLNYCGEDMQNWWNATAAEWGITVNNDTLRKWSGIHTDDAPNTYADNSLATTYARTYTTNAGYNMPGVAAHPYFSVYGPGGEPAVDSYWEKYHDVSGMYGDLGYFSDINSDNLYYKGAYNCPCMLVLQEQSTGKVYYMPVGFTDSSGHNYPIGSGQTYRAARKGYSWATTDINDPNAILAFAWNGWDPMYWPLCANVDKTTGEVGYVNRRNPLSVDILREYGCPSTHTITGPHELAYVTVYDYIKWMSENRAVNEGVSGASGLWTYFTKFECKPNLKSFLESGSYSMKGIIMCSTQTEGTGSSSGHTYDPNNPNPMPDSPSGSSRPVKFNDSLDCGRAVASDELNGSSQKGTIISDTFAGRGMRIYLPYGCDSSGATKYPVVVIKQGLSVKANRAFEDLKVQNLLDYHIANGDMEPVIVVSIDGEESGAPSWCKADADSNGNSNLRDLVSYLETNYNVSSNPRDRIVSGMSNGTIELRVCQQTDLELFGVVIMSSPYLSTDFLGKQSGGARPRYLLAVVCGSNDVNDCKGWVSAAENAEGASDGALFAQFAGTDQHTVYASMRNIMRVAEWYF